MQVNSLPQLATKSNITYPPIRSIPCRVCGIPIPLNGRKGRPHWYCDEHKYLIRKNHATRRNGTRWNKQDRLHILERDKYTCVYCKKPATGIDHVMPVRYGGPHSVANGVCSCLPCNRHKGWRLDIRGLKHLASKKEDILWAKDIEFCVWYDTNTYYAYVRRHLVPPFVIERRGYELAT